MRQIQSILLAVLCVALGACATGGGTEMDPSFWANATPAPDIAGIVMTANEGEIQQGNAAASRATTAPVREFAQMMVTDHTNALNMARDLHARKGITPAENAITAALRTGTQQPVTNLNTYSGAAFDRTYMQTQVDLHQWLLTSLDTALIPSARDPEVRAALEKMRGSVAMHLERARQIRGGL